MRKTKASKALGMRFLKTFSLPHYCLCPDAPQCYTHLKTTQENNVQTESDVFHC